MVAVSGVLRVAVDENAGVDESAVAVVSTAAASVARAEVAVAESPGKEFRRGMLSRLVNKIVCSGNCSRTVCNSAKAASNDSALQRYDYKMAKTRTLLQYLAKKKCTFRLVGGMGEFRGNWLPRTCAAHWAEFDQRMMAFESCSAVPQDGASQLSQAVWGLGSDAFKAAHASLDSFMKEVLTLLNIAYNGNSDIQSMLEAGDCTLKLDIVPEELTAAENRAGEGVELEASLEALDKAVFGPHCNFEEAKMPWMYLRMRLLKGIREMLHGVVATLLQDQPVNAEDLMARTVDATDSSDDSEVAAAEQQLLGHESEQSLIELGHEPVVTTTTVTIGTGIIIAAAVAGAAVLTITAAVLHAVAMSRRVTFKDRTNA
jgi:hypothetical protein